MYFFRRIFPQTLDTAFSMHSFFMECHVAFGKNFPADFAGLTLVSAMYICLMVCHRLLFEVFSTNLAWYALIYPMLVSHMHIQVTRIMKFTLTYETLVILDFMVTSFDMLPQVQSLNEGLITHEANDLLLPVVDSFTVTF